MVNREILILEDDPLLALMWRVQLGNIGCHITISNTLDEASQHLDQGLRPDIIITDYYLPDGTGLAFLHGLSYSYPSYHPNRILISSNPWMHLSVSDQRYVDRTLVKPILKDIMLELVQAPNYHRDWSSQTAS
jgi:CheY-like chemotaxis protein